MPRTPLSPRLACAPEPEVAEALAAKRARKAAAAEGAAEEVALPRQQGAGKEQRRRKEQAEEEAPVEEAAAKKQRQRKVAEKSEPVEEEVEAPKQKKARKAAAKAEEAAAPAAPAADAGAAAGGEAAAEEFRKKFQIASAREGQSLPPPVQSFDEAPFGKKIQKALKGAGFTSPSPIQAQGWPIAVAGQDLVAVAKTGSGKTLGFLLPAFKMIGECSEEVGSSAGSLPATPLVLVLAPTRELATQIEAECTKFGQAAKISSQAVFGGMPKQPQAKALKDGPQVLVATPGRLQDLMEMNAVSLKKVRFLVMDEADRMLDMGFEPEIAKILALTPAERQTLLFTATWPKAVKKIAANYLKKDYVHVNVGQTEELAANTAVSQEFYKLDDDEKEDKLWRILDSLPETAKLICFANTKRRIDGLAKSFRAKGFEAAALHGDKAQWERDRDLAGFANGDCWLMFATDVCARGLDIRSVTHVVNFDMARDVESYVHRIGRTGRAGASGVSITFWNEAYDTECAPALAKIAQEAGQKVPEFLAKAAAKQTQVKNKAWRY